MKPVVSEKSVPICSKNSILVALNSQCYCMSTTFQTNPKKWTPNKPDESQKHGSKLGARHGLVVVFPIPFHDSYAVCISDPLSLGQYDRSRWVHEMYQGTTPWEVRERT